MLVAMQMKTLKAVLGGLNCSLTPSLSIPKFIEQLHHIGIRLFLQYSAYFFIISFLLVFNSQNNKIKQTLEFDI